MNINNTLRKKRLVLLYVVVVVVLTVVSIYNAYSVVMGFLYDNVSTKVQIKTAYNIVPFAAYFTVSMDLYPESTWYPETWSMNRSNVSDLLYNYNVNSLNRLANRKNENSFSFSNARSELESWIDIAQMNDKANSLDYTFIGENYSRTLAERANPQMGKSWFVPAANYTDPSDYLAEAVIVTSDIKLKSDMMSSLDSFIANQYGEKLVDQALHRIMNFNYDYLYHVDTDQPRFFSDPPNAMFILDGFSTNHLSVSFSLDNLTNGSVNGKPIQLSVYPTSFNASPSRNLMNAKAVFSPVAVMETDLGRADLTIPIDVQLSEDPTLTREHTWLSKLVWKETCSGR